MTRPRGSWIGLAALAVLALASLAWGARNALRGSGDLVRRAEEVALVDAGRDPYLDPDMTYPPSAPAVFVPLVAPFEGGALRPAWLAFNLAALGAVIGLIVRWWGRG